MSSQPSAKHAIVNVMSVDVEDYFQVGAFENDIPRSRWEHLPLRVEANVDRILALMADTGVHGTFFTLGWVAERFPAMVRRIAEQGHEVASHGYDHVRVTNQTVGAFLADIRLTKAILEDVTGQQVIGYRAPSFSIGPKNPWAFDAILEAGYRYSSSVYPIRHDHYGFPNAPRFAQYVRPGLLEIPVTSVRAFFRNWPAAGGGYFRLLPYAISRWALRRVNDVDRKPTMFYFHPWEVDPEQPRIAAGGAKSRFRHYLNLHKVEPRLRRLFTDFLWDRADHVFLSPPSSSEAPPPPREDALLLDPDAQPEVIAPEFDRVDIDASGRVHAVEPESVRKSRSAA
jgi:polysaccharide deacetylase family protein (PEP-CTERM system associated)